MISQAQRVSSIYKSTYSKDTEPAHKLDKYDSSPGNNKDQTASKNFKNIFEAEMHKINKKISTDKKVA